MYIYIYINNLKFLLKKTFQKKCIKFLSIWSIVYNVPRSLGYRDKQNFAEKELFTELVKM